MVYEKYFKYLCIHKILENFLSSCFLTNVNNQICGKNIKQGSHYITQVLKLSIAISEVHQKTLINQSIN